MTRQACLDLARAAGRDPVDLVERWDERAAIREFDGGQPRADAERDAFEDVRRAVEVGALVPGGRRGPRPAEGAVVVSDPARARR